MWRGTLTPRKVGVLLRHLPPESAVMRAEGGEGSLTLGERLARQQLHAMQLRIYQAAGSKGTKPQHPKDPPTYWERRQEQQQLSARTNAYLDRHLSRLPANVAEKIRAQQR